MQTYYDRTYIQGELSRFTQQWRQKIDSHRRSSRKNFEISETQTFWNSLLACFDIKPGTVAEFERPARRASTGNHGRIDVFWPSVLLVEQKTEGKNLEEALDQARDYIAGGSIPEENLPRYLAVSDFERFIFVNRRTGDREEFTLEQLPERYDTLKFLAGEEAISAEEQQELTIAASKIMANLYQAMLGDADAPVGEDAAQNAEDEDFRVQETSMFLTRILFLLFGDDAGIWELHLFTRFLRKHTREDGSDLGTQINALFEYLDTPEAKRSRMRHVPELMARFPYVNGSLFAERTPTEYFTRELREQLLIACGFDWSQISTAIFGSMFQLVKSREARRAAGEHYTSEENILKTINPLFLDDLRARAESLIASAKGSKAKRAGLAAFLDELGSMHFMDPACGSGNFLQVAYMRLRELETRVLTEIHRLEDSGGFTLDASLNTRLSISQFHGIEINWWPSRIAEVAMFLSEFQADRTLARALGQVPTRLPITSVAHIVHADALATDWCEMIPAEATKVFIFGTLLSGFFPFWFFCFFSEPLIAHTESPTSLFVGDGVSGLIGHFIARVLFGHEFSKFIEEHRQCRVSPFVVHLQLSALATCELYALRFTRFNDQKIGRSVGKKQLQLCLFLDGWVVIDGNSLLIEREFIERLGLCHEHTSAQQRGVRGFYDGQLCVDQAGKKGQKAD